MIHYAIYRMRLVACDLLHATKSHSVCPPLVCYGVPFVSKLKKFEGLRFMLVFTTHDDGIYDSCWNLRRMVLVFMIHAGIYDARWYL